MLEYFTDLMRDVDLIVYGRKTYELMIPYWPDVAKDRPRQKQRMNLRNIYRHRQSCFFPDH